MRAQGAGRLSGYTQPTHPAVSLHGRTTGFKSALLKGWLSKRRSHKMLRLARLLLVSQGGRERKRTFLPRGHDRMITLL